MVYSNMDAAFMQLPAKIKRIRLGLALSQAQFAVHIGATQRNISNWERGSKPKVEAIDRMARFVGQSTEEFLGLIQSFEGLRTEVMSPSDNR